MFRVVKDAGRYLVIHSCGDIRVLLDDLAELGVDLVHPLQPEAMDVSSLLREYRGRVAFHGGLSTQKTLSRGTAEEVRAETRRWLELGAQGGYSFAPAHAAEGDTPWENMLAFLEAIQGQAGYHGDARRV